MQNLHWYDLGTFERQAEDVLAAVEEEALAGIHGGLRHAILMAVQQAALSTQQSTVFLKVGHITWRLQ